MLQWRSVFLFVMMALTFWQSVQFLRKWGASLRPFAVEERESLLAFIEKDYTASGLPFDGKLHQYDDAYYSRKYSENTAELDNNLVKEYFPVSAVVPAMLGIYEQLLGVRFEEMKESVWHPGM
jgi:Zn-dependent oligopeptidase